MTFGGEFWAAIAGAVVGGVIAVAIQLVSLRAAIKQREQDREDARKVLGQSVLFKMLRIHSNLYSFHQYLEESFQNAASQEFTGAPWQIVLAMANLPDRVRFSTEEMSLVLSFDDTDLLNRMLSADVVHNSLIEIFATFNSRRSFLAEQLPARMEGMRGVCELTKSELRRLEPRMAEVNQLVEDMRARSKSNWQEAHDTLAKLHTALISNLGFAYKLEIATNVTDSPPLTSAP